LGNGLRKAVWHPRRRLSQTIDGTRRSPATPGTHHADRFVGVKREFSAGGILVRRLRGRWMLAAIRPAGKKPGLWALPKGNIGPGEDPRETAVREVLEETGANGRLVEKLGDVRYTYTWAEERIFKIVSFFLLRYTSGRLGELPPATAHEVEEVQWLPLEDAPKLLAYGGEREMAEKALASVRTFAI
jgi:8-oxo-dGTP pyrophosphatase MutT (NUDIX family)